MERIDLEFLVIIVSSNTVNYHHDLQIEMQSRKQVDYEALCAFQQAFNP